MLLRVRPVSISDTVLLDFFVTASCGLVMSVSVVYRENCWGFFLSVCVLPVLVDFGVFLNFTFSF